MRKKAGVNLPARYDFTFAPQRKSLTLRRTWRRCRTSGGDQGRLRGPVRCRVHALNRCGVSSGQDDQGATDYLVGKKSGNQHRDWRGAGALRDSVSRFTAELAAVLEEFTVHRMFHC